MADNLLDIGDESIFPFNLNWSILPKSNFLVTRNLLQFQGTSSDLSELNPETPIIFEVLVSIDDMGSAYSLLEFIHDSKGDVIRFWIKYPKQMFKLVQDSSIGSAILYADPNTFDSAAQGYERIYITMKNGDIITKQVTSADIVSGVMQLGLGSALDREITTDNYFEIGRLLLVRFDSTDFEFKAITNVYLDITLRFFELVKEYSELAPNP